MSTESDDIKQEYKSSKYFSEADARQLTKMLGMRELKQEKYESPKAGKAKAILILGSFGLSLLLAFIGGGLANFGTIGFVFLGVGVGGAFAVIGILIATTEIKRKRDEARAKQPAIFSDCGKPKCRGTVVKCVFDPESVEDDGSNAKYIIYVSLCKSLPDFKFTCYKRYSVGDAAEFYGHPKHPEECRLTQRCIGSIEKKDN